jgi:hypothetical protein
MLGVCTKDNARLGTRGGRFRGSLAVSYFRAVYPALSSALRRFTVLFGMGRGGAASLWPPGNSGRSKWGIDDTLRALAALGVPQGYRIKPHGQLVRVSSTHYCAYTPRLSTSWSRTTLQGDQVPGTSDLEASFPLRCFQRLSLPHLATRHCDWRHNRYTSGASTPVLSY